MHYLYISDYNELSISNKIPSFVQLYFWIYGDTYCEYLQDLEPHDNWIVDRILERNDVGYYDAIKAYLYMKYNRTGVVWGFWNAWWNHSEGYHYNFEDIDLWPDDPDYNKYADNLVVVCRGERGKIDDAVMANKKRKQLKQPLKNAHLGKIINSGIIHDKKESRDVFQKILEIESDLYKDGYISPGLQKIFSIYLPPRLNERKIFSEVYRDLNGFLKKIIDEEGWLFDNRLQFTTQLLLFSLGYITVQKVISDREKIITTFPVLHDELECYRIGIGTTQAKKRSVICITSNLANYIGANKISSIGILQYHINNKLKYKSKLYNESLSIINNIYNQTSGRNSIENEKESLISERNNET